MLPHIFLVLKEPLKTLGAGSHPSVASNMLVLIIAIFALLRNSFCTIQLVYDPPTSSLEKTDTTNTSLSLEPTNATDASLVFSSTNGTDLDALQPWQNTTNTTFLDSAKRYSCSDLFGTHLKAESCINAIEQLGLTNDVRHTYGYRNTGVKWDYNIPQRWISCKPMSNTILRPTRNLAEFGLIHE